jgi:hypothetical protein
MLGISSKAVRSGEVGANDHRSAVVPAAELQNLPDFYA